MVRRHEIQVLRRAGHTLDEVAKLAGVSRRSVQRVEAEPAVVTFETPAERARRGIGRPSKVEAFRSFLVGELAKDPAVLAVELLRRARLQGYGGGKSALYELVGALRPDKPRPVVRFEGLAGEFSQHDFGQVNVRFLDGRVSRVHFFASRLKYSRWVEVSLVENERVESLVRAMVDHLHVGGWRPPSGRVRSAQDSGPELGPRRPGDRVESDLRGCGPGPGAGRGAVLAVQPRAEGLRRESGRLGQGILLQAAPLPGPRGPQAPAG